MTHVVLARAACASNIQTYTHAHICPTRHPSLFNLLSGRAARLHITFRCLRLLIGRGYQFKAARGPQHELWASAFAVLFSPCPFARGSAFSAIRRLWPCPHVWRACITFSTFCSRPCGLSAARPALDQPCWSRVWSCPRFLSPASIRFRTSCANLGRQRDFGSPDDGSSGTQQRFAPPLLCWADTIVLSSAERCAIYGPQCSSGSCGSGGTFGRPHQEPAAHQRISEISKSRGNDLLLRNDGSMPSKRIFTWQLSHLQASNLSAPEPCK